MHKVSLSSILIALFNVESSIKVSQKDNDYHCHVRSYFIDENTGYVNCDQITRILSQLTFIWEYLLDIPIVFHVI